MRDTKDVITLYDIRSSRPWDSGLKECLYSSDMEVILIVTICLLGLICDVRKRGVGILVS